MKVRQGPGSGFHMGSLRSGGRADGRLDRPSQSTVRLHIRAAHDNVQLRLPPGHGGREVDLDPLFTAPEGPLASVASWIFGGSSGTAAAAPGGVAISRFYPPASAAGKAGFR